MSQKVKFSILNGTRTLRSSSTAKESYEIMKAYWRDRIGYAALNRPDFITLPEACDRFLDMDEQMKLRYAPYRENESPGFFNSLAKEFDTAIVYNTRHDDRNTTFACSRTGELAGKYYKAFPMTTEIEQGIIPGPGAAVLKFDSIERAGFVTCFDLNFDELRKEYARQKPDVLFFNSMYHGGLVQRTWAYETRSFIVSSICERKSEITAPNGRVLAATTNYTDNCSAEVNLDCELIHLDFHREKLLAMKEKYGSGVTIDDVGYLGSVLVYCEMDDMNISNLIDEFGMTRLDDYLDHAREVRRLNLQK